MSANSEHTHHHHHHEHAAGEHDPMKELLALRKYMVGHNAQHASELAGLAKKLDDRGEHAAYEQVMQAVSDFEKGNERLTAVLASLTE